MYDTPSGNKVMPDYSTKTAGKVLFDLPDQKHDGGNVHMVG